MYLLSKPGFVHHLLGALVLVIDSSGQLQCKLHSDDKARGGKMALEANLGEAICRAVLGPSTWLECLMSVQVWKLSFFKSKTSFQASPWRKWIWPMSGENVWWCCAANMATSTRMRSSGQCPGNVREPSNMNVPPQPAQKSSQVQSDSGLVPSSILNNSIQPPVKTVKNVHFEDVKHSHCESQ